MKIIRTVIGCGSIAKTVKLQIFLEPKFYFEVLQEAKATGMVWKNDSELVRKILYKNLYDSPMQKLQLETQQNKIAKMGSVMDALQNKIDEQGAKKK